MNRDERRVRGRDGDGHDHTAGHRAPAARGKPGGRTLTDDMGGPGLTTTQAASAGGHSLREARAAIDALGVAVDAQGPRDLDVARAALLKVQATLSNARHWHQIASEQAASPADENAAAQLAAELAAVEEQAAPALAMAPGASAYEDDPTALLFDPAAQARADRADERARQEWHRRLDQRVPVQAKRDGAGALDAGDVHAHAARGIEGSGSPLPHLDAIQASFGAHDVRHVRAHVGGDAAASSRAIGAEAYAMGDHVAFALSPSLHTAAHEAAHVVQQRGGVQLEGGVGAAGDVYEQQADQVADAVVRGESAEGLLGAPSASRAAPAVQRTPAAGEAVGDTFEPSPNRTHTIELKLAEGDTSSLTFKVTASVGSSGVASDNAEDVGPFPEASWKALEPKVTRDLNSFGKRLSLALGSGELDVLEIFEGVSLSIKATGPELELKDGVGDLSLLKVSVKGKGDVSQWIAETGHHVPFKLKIEIEGSWKLGGKLLAKIAEVSATAARIAEKTDELDAIADKLDRDRAVHDDLVRRRDDLRRKMNTAGVRERRELSDQLSDVKRSLQAQKREIGDALDRTRELQRELVEDAKELTKLEKTLDGKIAKGFARRISQAAAHKLGRAVAKLLPVVNAVSFVADAYDIGKELYAWYERGFNLPEGLEIPEVPSFNWFPPATDEDGAPGGGDDERETGEDAGGDDAGEPSGGPAADGTGPSSEVGGATTATGEATGGVAEARGTPGGDVDRAAIDGLHRRARAVFEVIHRDGVALSRTQIEALAQIVPADLTNDQGVRLIQEIVARKGDVATDPHEVLALIGDAVRSLERETVSVTVDGVARPDLVPSPDAATTTNGAAVEPTHGHDSDGGDHGATDSDEATFEPADLATIVFQLPESVVESWLTFEGDTLGTAGFDAWRTASELAAIPGREDEVLANASIATEQTKRGEWWVTVEFALEARGRTRLVPHTFLVTSSGDRPHAERVFMFTVTR